LQAKNNSRRNHERRVVVDVHSGNSSFVLFFKFFSPDPLFWLNKFLAIRFNRNKWSTKDINGEGPERELDIHRCKNDQPVLVKLWASLSENLRIWYSFQTGHVTGNFFISFLMCYSSVCLILLHSS
jgi:hypothetical protein